MSIFNFYEARMKKRRIFGLTLVSFSSLKLTENIDVDVADLNYAFPQLA